MKPASRNVVLAIHRWTGMTVGLVAAFLALTGLTMTFRAQLEPRVDAELLARAPCVARLPLDALAGRARAAHPGGKIARIEILDIGTGATVVRFSDREGIYLDACTGELLARRTPWGGFFGFIEQVHKFRFISEDTDVTETIGGSAALVVAMLLAGGGLTLAWPASRRGLEALVKPRLAARGRAFDLTLHKSTGFYACAVILFSTTCALMFTFDWARSTVFAMTGTSLPPPKPAAKAGAPMRSLEDYLASAREAMPDMAQAVITLPRKSSDSVEVYAIDRAAPHPYARSYLYFDPASGERLRFSPYEASGAGNKAYRTMQALHTGRAGALFQLVLFTGILGIPILAFTGIRSYLRSRAPRRPT